MQFSVIDLRVRISCYGYLNGLRRDLEPAVRHRQLYSIVRALNLKVFFGQTHGVGSNILTFSLRFFSGLQPDRHAFRRIRRKVDYGLQFSVIDLRVRISCYGYLNGLRRDLEPAVRRLRNDILFCRVNRALGSVREVSVICSSIRSRRANFNRAEISVFRRTGKAGNFLLLSIIRHSLAVRFQLDVLIIVEIDLVLSLDDLNRLLFIRFRRNCVAFNRGGGCLHRFPERLAVKGLGSRNLLGRPVPVIVHRIAQVVPLTINDRHSRIFGQRSCHNGLIRLITGDNRRIYVVTVRIRKRIFVTYRRFATVFIHIVDFQLVAVLLKLRRKRRVLIQRICPCVCRFLIQLAVDVIQVIICLTIISFPTGKLISIGRRRNRDGQTPTVRKVARHRLNLVCSAVLNRSAFAGFIGNVNGLFFVRLVVHIDRNRVVSDFLILNFSNVFIAFKGQRLSFGQLAILLIFCFFFQNLFRRRIFDDMLDRIRHVDLFEINNAVHMPREYRFRLIVFCASGELVSCPSHIAKRNQFIVFPWF